jgi:hypothetical protein
MIMVLISTQENLETLINQLQFAGQGVQIKVSQEISTLLIIPKLT